MICSFLFLSFFDAFPFDSGSIAALIEAASLDGEGGTVDFDVPLGEVEAAGRGDVGTGVDRPETEADAARFLSFLLSFGFFAVLLAA